MLRLHFPFLGFSTLPVMYELSKIIFVWNSSFVSLGKKYWSIFYRHYRNIDNTFWNRLKNVQLFCFVTESNMAQFWFAEIWREGWCIPFLYPFKCIIILCCTRDVQKVLPLPCRATNLFYTPLYILWIEVSKFMNVLILCFSSFWQWRITVSFRKRRAYNHTQQVKLLTLAHALSK